MKKKEDYLRDYLCNSLCRQLEMFWILGKICKNWKYFLWECMVLWSGVIMGTLQWMGNCWWWIIFRKVVGNVCPSFIQGDIDFLSICRNPTLAKCGGEAQHLEKVRIWSPSRLPNFQSSTARGKTPRIGVFLVSLERSWNVDI